MKPQSHLWEITEIKCTGPEQALASLWEEHVFSLLVEYVSKIIP